MNISKIKEIVNDNFYPDDIKRHLIISIISKDEEAIPDILKILAEERKRKKKLINEFNLQLSRAHIVLEGAKFTKKSLNHDHFVEREIEGFYHNFKDDVHHLYKDLNKMQPNSKQNNEDYSI